MAARRGPQIWPSEVVHRGDVATHIDANILPVFFWLLGYRFMSRPVNKTVRNLSFRCLQARQVPGSGRIEPPNRLFALNSAV